MADIRRHTKLIPLVPAKLQAVSGLKKANLEYTVFYNGIFLDYLGFNGIKSYLPPTTLILDLPHDIAAIPGDGNMPVVFTHTTDIAKYVAASLDLPAWDPESYVVGEKTTWGEVVRIAQELKGKILVFLSPAMFEINISNLLYRDQMPNYL